METLRHIRLAHEVIFNQARAVLRAPRAFKWQVQGLGMLRTYLSPGVRMHVWNPDIRYCGDSDMHDHPWDFESYIVSGRLRNRRYTDWRPDPHMGNDQNGEMWMTQTIQCGIGGCLKGESHQIKLVPSCVETYESGDAYSQKAEEVHASLPEPGCVSIIHRTFSRADRDTARVFWPIGQEWTSAEPRDAKPAEIDAAVERALALMGE